MNKVNCPLCHHFAYFNFQKGERKFFKCDFCQSQFIWPLPTAAELQKFYQAEYWENQSFRGESALGYSSYLAEKESFLDYFEKVFCQIKNFFSKPGRVLDIGCSFGFFLEVAKKYGWEIWGVDLSLTPVSEARKNLGVKTIFKRDFLKVKFPPAFFDLVTCFQTIEHVASPIDFVKEVYRILKPRGLFLFSTPDAGGWQAKLMRKNWFAFRHPEHLWFFKQKSLFFLLKKGGFTKIKKIKDPTRLYPLNYLLENFKFYFRERNLIKLAKFFGKAISPAGKIKIPIPLTSLVITAQK
ncbi:MAG: class I SAM-dependent methyltransferase [Microgenomates group bacterium]